MQLFIKSFGCQMNDHDSEKIASLLMEEGYQLIDDPQEADCIILNTCSVREKPEQKVYSALGRLAPLKRRRPHMVIGVGGCVAQQVGERLLEKVPHLDFVFGTHQISRVPELVKAAREGIRSVSIEMTEDPASLHYSPRPLKGQVKAYVTIMQGCSNLCSYCIVPYVRGPEQSRPVEEIVDEATRLAEAGVKEIMLLGQNVNSYGRSLRGRPTFSRLLEKIQEIPGIERIRFTTSHPKDLSGDLIDAIASLSKVCEHLHLPVQSGSNKVLEAMNRGYTREEYLEKILALRDKVPSIAFSTDIIVGFPGETETDLELTLELLMTVRFDFIYSFKFSPRPFTKAFSMKNDVPAELKAERLKKVQSLQEAITSEILEGCVGKVEEILIEGPSVHGGGQLMGRTRTNRIVHLKGEASSLSGRLVRVKIARSLKHSLWGETVEEWNDGSYGA